VVASARVAGAEAPLLDLLDPDSIDSCLEVVAPELILNAAGDPSVARSWERAEESFAVNATGARNLLAVVAERAPAAHVTCLSSAAVYGQPGPEEMPLREDSPVAPASPYGEAKLAMEGFCHEAAARAGTRVAVVRAFNLVGPGQPAHNAASALARQIAAAEREGREEVELTLGNPGAARDLVDVRDGARALVELAGGGLTGSFNLCSGRAHSVAELAAGLAAETSLRVGTEVDPALARPADPALLLGDPARLRAATGFAPEIPLQRSLADLLAWWREQLGGA